ncbi:SgcJ/EcaC family oxidoreductase [Streptomyces sp. wa22]|nr:SgcJ/EcaC family oxidoreductase [Streptomyces sp. wa22]
MDTEAADTTAVDITDTAAIGSGDTADTETTDIAALEQVVAAVERTQRVQDVDGFLALFHPEALWTTGHGKVLIGLDAIAEFTRAVLPAADREGEVTYRAVHTQFLRPDVAAVKVRQVYHSPEGETEGAPLYVMTKQRDGRWLLHVCQNTEVRVA